MKDNVNIPTFNVNQAKDIWYKKNLTNSFNSSSKDYSFLSYISILSDSSFAGEEPA